MSLLDTIKQERSEIPRLATAYGASNVRIFDSVARGDADAESDVDFMVDLAPGHSLFDLSGLLMELQDLLERPVDVVTERGLRDRFCKTVAQEALPL